MPEPPAEFQLLAACAARVCGRDAALPSAAPLNPSRLLDAARRHRLVPLLQKFFLHIPASELFAMRLRAEFSAAVRGILALTGALLDLQTKFAGEGIVAVPLKGPALAAQIYGGETLRTCDDVDFLIRAADFPRAHDLLLGACYEPMFQLRRFQWRAFQDYFDEVAYRQRDSGVEVDLQWRACSGAYAFAPDSAAWFQRLEKISISGRSIPALGCGDLLDFLLLHGSKHGWARLGWLMDIGKIIAGRPLQWQVEWAASGGAARRMRGICLALLNRVLAVPIDPNIQQSCAPDHELLSRIVDGMSSDGSARRPLGNYALFPEIMERAADRRRYRFETTFRPTPWEWQLLPLPGMLCPLYFVLRPLRIAARRAMQTLRASSAGNRLLEIGCWR